MEVERIEWQDAYSVGIGEVDKQHKHLVELSGQLYDLLFLHPEKYAEQITEIMQELAAYADYHFKCEEKNYFAKYNYPSTSLHVMQHDNFINLISHRIEELNDTDVTDGIALYSYLTKWLVSHIGMADKSWAAFVKPKL